MPFWGEHRPGIGLRFERENWIIRTMRAELSARQVFPGYREYEVQFE